MRFNEDHARLVWAAAAATLLAGSYFVHARYEPAIAASYARSETLYAQTQANERTVREAANLRLVQARAETDLAHVLKNQSLPMTTAEFLSTLERIAHGFNTRVLQLQPGVAASADPALHATPLTIEVEGTFRNIVGFIDDLSHHSTLVSVSDTALALSGADSRSAAEPRLDATIHATLYRLAIPNERSPGAAADQQ